jgi:hypothetical protein
MGSGETTPTMTKHHRRLLEAAGPGQKVMLDSPYGFQENADDITARTLDYFNVSVVTELDVVSLRKPEIEPRLLATATATALDAAWLYAGPGSPTYAMRVWSAVGLGDVVHQRLVSDSSNVTVFSSAAALTLGKWCVPVYEVYKVGADPFWADGLDVIHSATGLECVVIPHFDNAEGGNHDTRFCYLGETRLQKMEAMLPDTTWVLGVDEHTVVVFDLETGAVDVGGRGAMTVRTRTSASRFETGSTTTIAELHAIATGVAAASADSTASEPSGPTNAATGQPIRDPHSPDILSVTDSNGEATLISVATVTEQAFAAAMAKGDVGGAVDSVLRLENELEAWKGDTSTTDERDRTRAALHRMVVRLGEVAVDGSRDPRDVLGPVVEVALAERLLARQAKDFAGSDRIRHALTSAGVDVRDTPDGQQWSLLNESKP